MNDAFHASDITTAIDVLSTAPAVFPWYAIRTKSNQERLASSSLTNKGYAPFLPTYSERRRWSDRITITERPLFPGYFFCRFDPRNRMPVLTTPGIVSVLGFGSGPAPIPDSEIANIESVIRSGLGAYPCPFVEEGQRIHVIRGFLEGLEGIVLRKRGEWRLVVSVNMLHRSVSIEIDREDIAAL